MRCEPNISVMPPRQQGMGHEIELKNLNSFRAVQRGIDYEYASDRGDRKRRKDHQETRRWDDVTQTTVTMRSKEQRTTTVISPIRPCSG